MADQSGPTRFRAQFESALQTYQKIAGVTLAKHPLTENLQDSHSIESITTILKDKCLVSSDLLKNNRITKVMESTIPMLFTISATESFGGAIQVRLVRKEELMAYFTSLKGLYSHTHLR
jgi:hypothetical protein